MQVYYTMDPGVQYRVLYWAYISLGGFESLGIMVL